MLRSLLIFVFVCLSFNLIASETLLTLNSKFLKELPPQIYKIENKNKDIYLIKIKSEYVDTLAFIKNSKLGGFVVHSSLEKGNEFLFKNFERICIQNPPVRYSITETDIIPSLLIQIKESNLVSTVNNLSNFFNRHYKN